MLALNNGTGHGQLSEAEALTLTDTLALKCGDPGNLKVEFFDHETGDPLPPAALTNLTFSIATKFSISPDGITCRIGPEPLVIKLDGWDEWYTPDKTVRDCVKAMNMGGGTPRNEPTESDTQVEPLPQGNKLPEDAPQFTFQEMRAVNYAMADTSTLRHWTPIDENSGLSILSMLYKRPGERFEIKFDPNALTDELKTGLQLDTINALENFLRMRGFRGTLALQFMGQAAILKTDEPISLDYFVNKLFEPRSAKERQEARAWMWDTMRTVLALRLYGSRGDVYKDPETKKPIDLTFRGEPFIALSPGARRFASGQQPLWPNADVPVIVGFTMGAWGKDAKKNPAILAHFGKMDEIASIKPGKASGAWAQCILFNLNQLWREGAKDVAVTTHRRIDSAGNERKTVATRWPRTFTRRQLLADLCPPDQAFSVTDILSSDTPNRAKRYWTAAIRILQDQGSISYYKELGTLTPKRKGWADEWLDQQLDIRPDSEGQKKAREIHDSHKKTQAANKKRKPKKAP